ncbi:MAG TPA: tetratricopeptide repeat protein [Bryobacteraceae bacterium]|jgi:tetratricopeptide (TPR) repeat protein
MRGISCILAASLLWAASAREEGIAAFEAGRYSVALAKLKEATQDPHDVRARLFLALTQAAMGDCQSALPNLPATDRLAGLAAAKCYAAIGEEGKAFSTLEELRKRFPNDADVLYLRARLHMKAFNDATLDMFQDAPASYRVHELSAEVLEVQNRYSEAAAEYRKAIELNPAAPDLHYRLGRAILLESHNPEALERAAAEFRAELKLSPEDAACEFQLGQIAQVAGKQAEAKPHFERAVALSPGFVQALIALAKLEPSEKAIPLLKKAVDLQPSNEGAHYALLTAYRNAGDMDEAAAEKAILDRLQKPAGGEFSDFLKKLGEKPAKQ